MPQLMLPDQRVPIGYAVVNGQRVPVYINPEWQTKLLDLLRQVNAGG